MQWLSDPGDTGYTNSPSSCQRKPVGVPGFGAQSRLAEDYPSLLLGLTLLAVQSGTGLSLSALC